MLNRHHVPLVVRPHLGVTLGRDCQVLQFQLRVHAVQEAQCQLVLGDADGLRDHRVRAARKLAVHCPCTLQHAQKLGHAVERVLGRLGFALSPVADGHLCCGSAGSYSLTQPAISTALRDRKLDALEAGKPELIATANIGCQSHLNSAGRTPVVHWIELVDAALA